MAHHEFKKRALAWIICGLLGLPWATPALALTSSASRALTLTADTPWVVSDQEPEAVQRALADVERDWYKVFNHVPVVLDEPPENWPGPVIYLGLEGPWRKGLIHRPFPGAESFFLAVERDGAGRQAVVATGADTRGAIYAAYTFSQEVLGVDPWYYWVDKEPAQRDRIEVPGGLDENFGPPTFKYRGWFINDEDLLNGFAPDPMRENPYSLEMLDHICETLLRLRGNMIEPGSFTFPDERCQELASRRGLILTQHHVQVLGLNTYRWPADVPFSYLEHPNIMERFWRTCINAYKGRDVIWSIGYRGKDDQPFWVDEPDLTTDAQRGAMISRVMARQVQLVRQACPKVNFIANLWSEGADLYRAGLVKIPPGVTLVWPDDGSGVIRDNGQVRPGEGIYYHTMMLNGRENRVTEMVNPARIYHEIGRFVRAGATAYFLVNVSNLRPVPLSTDCAMDLVWDAGPYLKKTDQQNMDDFLLDWSQRQFGAEAAPQVAAIWNRYFNIPYQSDKEREGVNAIANRLKELEEKTACRMCTNEPLPASALKMARDDLNFTDSNLPYVSALASRAEVLADHIPAERRDFYQAHVSTQAEIHLHLLEMLQKRGESVEAYGRGDRLQAVKCLQCALHASDTLFTCLSRGEYGKWAGWYSGEHFLGIESARDRLRDVLAGMMGEPAPPVRVTRGYPYMYQYQTPFAKNFPLMYPAAADRQ